MAIRFQSNGVWTSKDFMCIKTDFLPLPQWAHRFIGKGIPKYTFTTQSGNREKIHTPDTYTPNEQIQWGILGILIMEMIRRQGGGR